MRHPNILDLNRQPRRVAPWASESSDEVLTFEAYVRADLGSDAWPALLSSKLCLLVGPAHCGKSTELKLLRGRLRGQGTACFLLDMKVLLEESVSDVAASGDSLDSWLHDGTRKGVFLLDALDEAVLCDDRALQRCLRKLAAAFGPGGVARAHFVVTSRPGAWSSQNVLVTIRESLGLADSAGQPSILAQPAEEELDEASVADPAPDDVVFARLPPLTQPQTDRLLRQVHGISDPQHFCGKARDVGLSFGLSSPGSISWLVKVVPGLPAGSGRGAAFDAAVNALADAAFENRSLLVPCSRLEFIEELERLCAAAHFCRTDTFALRGASDIRGTVSLGEAVLKIPRFETFLQSSPFFDDVGISRIKWMPDPLLPYLAARWLARRIGTGTISADEAFDLFCWSSFHGPVVPSALEVVAGWLACMNRQFCRLLMEVAPHAVLLYADLALVSVPDARKAVSGTLQALEAGRPLLYRSVRLTSDDFWQAMRPELESMLVAAMDTASSLDALYILVRMVESRAVRSAAPALSRLLAGPETSRHILPRALSALSECGSKSAVEAAVDGLLARGINSPQIATEAFEALMKHGASRTRLVKLLATGNVELIQAGVVVEAAAARGLHHVENLLQACADLESRSTGVDTPRLRVAVLKGLLGAGLVDDVPAPFSSALQSRMLDLLEETRASSASRVHGRFDDVVPLLAKVPVLRAQAVRRLLQTLKPQDFWRLAHSGSGLYLTLGVHDIPELTELSKGAGHDRKAAIKDLVSSLTPRPPAPALLKKARAAQAAAKPQEDPKFVASRLTTLASGQDAHLLANLMHEASGGRASSKLDAADWKRLTQLYGEPVQGAVRQGLRNLWRLQAPVEDPQNPQALFSVTLAALAGLHDEFGDGNGAALVAEPEREMALRYGLEVLNQFPPWVHAIVAEHPAQADRFFASVIGGWKASPLAGRRARDTVTRLPDALSGLGTRCRAALWAYLAGGGCQNFYETDRVLSVLCMEATDPNLVPYLREKTPLVWDRMRDYFAAFFPAWLRVDTAHALEYLNSCAQTTDGREHIVGLASYWSDSMESPLKHVRADGAEVAGHLEQLCLILMRTLPPAQDPEKLGVYMPTDLDNAVHFRRVVLDMIEKIGGHGAYAAFNRLAARYQEEPEVARVFTTRAVKVAEAEVLPTAWSTTAFVAFAKDAMETPVDSENALWKRVHRDVRTVGQNLKSGTFHLGDLLKLGDERDMQLWLARELELLSRQAYAPHREPELQNRTTPDIVIHTQRSRVTLELKVADQPRHSVTSLLYDLEQQLYGDYLNAVDSNHGIFVVMSKGGRRTFMHHRKAHNFEQMIAVLTARASELTLQTEGRKHVAVIGLVCPPGRSDRHLPKGAGKAGRSKSPGQR